MKIVHIQPAQPPKVKKLPMDKDPRFLAMLRKEIIDDHNRKISAKQKKKKAGT